MDKWDELRTALYVHELGTVSAAAEALGVHRATVIRHIDTLEHQFGKPLFKRHAQGYTATDVCAEALIAVKQAEKLFEIVNGKVRGQQPIREKKRIVVSVVPSVTGLVARGVGEFLEQHRDVCVEIDSSDRIYQLDSGEADLVVRGGAKPRESGVVAEFFFSFSIGLYATENYLRKKGTPKGIEDYDKHLFVGPRLNKMTPFAAWARRNLPRDNLNLLAESGEVALQITLADTAIGLLPEFLCESYPQLRLLQKLPDSFNETLWLAMHKDGTNSDLVARLLHTIQKHAAT